jgi:potassium-transporting ATPase KdpC subunit
MIRIGFRALIATVVLMVLTGVLYPLAITAVGQLALRGKADGSLVTSGGRVVGSSAIGQTWTGDRWFYGRPSAVSDDASTSSGTNLGPTSAQLASDIQDRAAQILSMEGPYTPGLTTAAIPVDLLLASASGLDPDISEAAALFQVSRIAAVRHLSASQVRGLVEEHVQGPDLGFLGEPRVNVMELNLALQQLGG